MLETRAVLAGAYRGRSASLAATRTHSFDTRTGRVLCGGVKADSLADVMADNPNLPPTCPTCRKRDLRSKSAGPFVLASMLQF